MSLSALVKEKVSQAYHLCGFSDAQTLVRLSDRPDISDFQSNGALTLAKTLKQNPRAIAQQIADILVQDLFFEKISVDGPGFINMTISKQALTENANVILNTPTLGYERLDEPKTVVVDYGGPNVAKALHVGHLRPAVIGESVKRIHIFAGDKTIGDVHLGDWGLPMGLLITEIREKQPDLPYFDDSFTGEYPKEPPFTVKDLETMYPIASQKSKTDAEYLATAKENTRLLQNGHRGFRALWQHFIDTSIAEIRKLYDPMDIQFDLWRGESHVHDRLQEMIVRLQKEGLIVPDSGAEVIHLPKSSTGNDLPPLIMVKSDGAVMYGATDLATIEERVDEFNPDSILYVVDARQGLHFEQVFAGAEKIGLTKKVKLQHLGFGTINGKDNKPFKTRDGGVMTLKMLIEIATNSALAKMNAGEMGRGLSETEKTEISSVVGVSALKFADLMNERMKNYIFDEDKLTSTEGKTGPYVLYALVRMKSVLEKMGATREITDLDKMTITESAERQLLLRLYQMPESLQTAYDNNAPHVICDYLYKLAQDFNVFYHDCPIKDAEETVKTTRLALTKYALAMGEKMAWILGLRVPEKM